jgi:hypothetical protein
MSACVIAARRLLEVGVNALADAVKVTLGPKGRNADLEKTVPVVVDTLRRLATEVTGQAALEASASIAALIITTETAIVEEVMDNPGAIYVPGFGGLAEGLSVRATSTELMTTVLHIAAVLLPVLVPRALLGRKQPRQRLDVLLYRCESST